MKKRLNLTLLLLAVFVLTSASVLAQGQEKESMPPAERASKLTQWMKDNLQLTPDQEKQAQEINLKYANKTEELRSSTGTRMQKFKKLKSYNELKDEELKKVFTAEQFKTYQAKKEEVKEDFKAKAKEKKVAQ
jgi:hypothetical protein